MTLAESAGGGAASPHRQDGAEHLVKMANDIGHFFGAEPQRAEAVAGIVNHISKFWTKRMRDKLRAHIKNVGDAELEELPREALRQLMS